MHLKSKVILAIPMLCVCCCLNVCAIRVNKTDETVVAASVVSIAEETVTIPGTVQTIETETVLESEEDIVEVTEENYESLMTDEEIKLIALVTMAEAEGECEEGKRLVIDTILNRVDSGYFPDTVYEVIYQPNQFSSMWNGRVDRCEVRNDICKLVLEELEARTNYEVVFFTAGHYSNYGVPLFQVGNHYFSRYE